MKLTADTNVLIRAVVADDLEQAALAQQALANAELIAVPVSVFCEFVWVLTRSYKLPTPSIAEAIRRLTRSANVVTHQPAVDAGLAMLEAGGDFADGVIAFEGAWLGADTFVTFDRRAGKLVEELGGAVHLLQC